MCLVSRKSVLVMATPLCQPGEGRNTFFVSYVADNSVSLIQLESSHQISLIFKIY